MTPLVLLLACGPAPAPEDTANDDVPRGALAFALPLADRSLFTTRIGIDHDGIVQDDTPEGRIVCEDYLARENFPHCYDEHDGTDFLLDGGFTTMDAGSSPVRAAADGTVIETVDGNYDRCHADIETGTVTCDGYPMVANLVRVEHDLGVVTTYAHLMSGSLTVSVGDEVACGDPLGLVGSSGYSSQPHLHFEVTVDAATIDPFAGPSSQPETWWAEQPDDPDALPGDGCAATG